MDVDAWVSLGSVLVAAVGLGIAWLARRDARTSAAATAKATRIAEEHERQRRVQHHDRLGPQIQQVFGSWDRDTDSLRVGIRITGGPALTHIVITVVATNLLRLSWDHHVPADGESLYHLRSNARRGERFTFSVHEVSGLDRHATTTDEVSVPLAIGIWERGSTDGQPEWERVVEVVGVAPDPSGDDEQPA